MNIIQGSKFAMSHTVTGLAGEQYLTDEGVDIAVTYYVSKSYESKVCKIIKSAMSFEDDSDCNTFTAVVDTTGMPIGKLMCLFEVKYKLNGKDILERFTVSSDVTIASVQ